MSYPNKVGKSIGSNTFKEHPADKGETPFLDMHGLVIKTSIFNWQDQPGENLGYFGY